MLARVMTLRGDPFWGLSFLGYIHPPTVAFEPCGIYRRDVAAPHGVRGNCVCESANYSSFAVYIVCARRVIWFAKRRACTSSCVLKPNCKISGACSAITLAWRLQEPPQLPVFSSYAQKCYRDPLRLVFAGIVWWKPFSRLICCGW